MRPQLDITPVRDREPSRLTPTRQRASVGEPASAQERLAWYRERDRDPEDLHRRYVRAKFRLREWGEADLRRFHRYRRSVSRERAAQLVIARRYALAGLTALALAGLVAGLIYAAYRWWKRQATGRQLPPAKKPRAAKGKDT